MTGVFSRSSWVRFGAVSLVFGMVATTTAFAVTPTQMAVAEARAKAEAAQRGRAAADAKVRADALAKAKLDSAAKAKAQAVGAFSVHQETKRRLAATRSAAALHSRVIEASTSTSAGSGETGGGSGTVRRGARKDRTLVEQHRRTTAETTAPRAKSQ